MNSKVFIHEIRPYALDHGNFPLYWHVYCTKCKSVMLNWEIEKTPCEDYQGHDQEEIDGKATGL